MRSSNSGMYGLHSWTWYQDLRSHCQTFIGWSFNAYKGVTTQETESWILKLSEEKGGMNCICCLRTNDPNLCYHLLITWSTLHMISVSFVCCCTFEFWSFYCYCAHKHWYCKLNKCGWLHHSPCLVCLWFIDISTSWLLKLQSLNCFVCFGCCIMHRLKFQTFVMKGTSTSGQSLMTTLKLTTWCSLLCKGIWHTSRKWIRYSLHFRVCVTKFRHILACDFVT